MKTILVTGGGGFIGSNLVSGLLARGTHHVVVCDHFGSNDKWRNLCKHAVYEIVPPEQMFAWLDTNHKNVEMVYHLGAISSTVEKDIDRILENNAALTLKLWRWCSERAVRFVYASSSVIYGDGKHGFDDSIDLAYMNKLKPLSGHGWSKHLFDMHIAAAFARGECKTPQWMGLRLFNVYGPNEYHKGEQRSVITKMAEQAVKGAAVRLFRSYNKEYADGDQKRDMIYVKDVVRVMLWCLDHPEVSGIYNIGTGKADSFNAMAKAIFSAINKPANIHYIDMPEDLLNKYQYFTEANIGRLRAAGYNEPFTSLQDGIKDYVQNYLMQDDQYL